MPLVVLCVSSLFAFCDLFLGHHELLFQFSDQAFKFSWLLANDLGIEAAEFLSIVHGTPALPAVLWGLWQTNHPSDIGVTLDCVLKVLSEQGESSIHLKLSLFLLLLVFDDVNNIVAQLVEIHVGQDPFHALSCLLALAGFTDPLRPSHIKETKSCFGYLTGFFVELR